MALSEFALIARYFAQARLAGAGADLGIGDDAALLSVPGDCQLVVAADTLVQGVHFPPALAAADIGYRALAVNLSDLAAMGAAPRWYTLCLTLPAAEAAWLADFCDGLAEAAGTTGISLVGGDTTRGPLCISVQILGTVKAGAALLRSGAAPGDGVYVTGTLGDAAGGLALIQAGGAGSAYLQRRFRRPSPRLREAGLLAGLASACIDISDGLLADLGHICDASAVAASLQLPRLPLSDALLAAFPGQAQDFALAGGDDYELCFTVPPALTAALERRFGDAGCRCSRIGEIVAGRGVRCIDANGDTLAPKKVGYEHF